MSDAATPSPGWTASTLGACFEWTSGGTPSRSVTAYYGGNIPWLMIGDLNDGVVAQATEFITEDGLANSSAKWVEPDSIMVALYGSIGKLGIAGIRLTTNQAIAFARTGDIPPKYVLYYLLGKRSDLHRLGQGGTQKNINQAILKAFPFPLAPLPEQRRIVAKIEELFSDLDAGVAALKRVRANLKRYRAAVLKAAVEGRLTEEWRKQHPSTEPAAKLLERILTERRAKWEQDQLRKFKDAGKTPPKGWKEKYEPPAGPTDAPPDDLPATWSWCTIEQAAAELPRAIQSGPFGSNLLHSEFQDSGVLAIGIDNVQSGRFSLGSGHRISEAKFEELQKYEARPLDFLITVMATVGRCCVVPADLERAIITKHVYRVSLESRLINAYFLQSAVLGGPIVKRQIFGEVRGQTRPGINGEILRQVAVPIPPLAEQAEIVAEVDRRLSVADAAEQQVEHALQRAARLRQSILKRAFEGKLVSQDPTDEPAATMLERAKAPANGSCAVIETDGTPRRNTSKRRSRARA